MNDHYYLNEALNLAKKSWKLDEVPVGAVVVVDDEIIGLGYNDKESRKIATGHAEIMALNQACQRLNSWRLETATIYITLEPCLMCLGAIIHARVKRIVYGAKDKKSGAVGGLSNILDIKGFNHYPEVIYIENTECSAILKQFFQNKRKQ